jgi:regulator of replication initiation timing
MERKEVISTLEDLKSRCPKYIKEYQALDYAISSIKTDLAYDLMYEGLEVEEVVHAKWVKEHGYENDVYQQNYCCSACNQYYSTDPKNMLYCPHCGARMDGGNEEV